MTARTKQKAPQPKGPTISPSEEFNPADYNAIVATAQLVTIDLSRSSLEMTPGFNDGEGISARLQGGSLVHYLYDDEAGFAVGVFQWSVEVKKEASDASWVLHCSYTIMYDQIPDRNPAAVREFVDRVGRFAVYPYFRNYVAVTAAASNVPLPPLPVLRQKTPKMCSAKKKSASTPKK